MGNTSFQNNKLDMVSSKVSLQLIDMKINIRDISISIQVYYGNDIYPKLWDIPIIECRQQSLAQPLLTKRFFNGAPMPNYLPFTFIEKQQQINTQNIFQNPIEKNQQFYTIRVPSYIINDELPPLLIANYSQNTIQEYEKQKFQYSNSKIYRYQYREVYSKVFSFILKSMKTSKSIGILDLPVNNPLIGVNLQNIVQDILDSFIETVQNIDSQDNTKLIFSSESKSQASLISNIIQNLITQNSKYFQNEFSQIKQLYLFNSLKKRKDRNSDKQNINSSLKQYISHKKMNIYTFHNYITRLFIQRYDQKKLEDVDKYIVTLNPSNNYCLCGQKVELQKMQGNCCYCFINCEIFMKCTNNACQRQYCSSCKYIIPKKITKLIQQNQEWVVVKNSVILSCHSCKTKIDIGKQTIRKQFRTYCITICLQCYYLGQIAKLYEKYKVTYQIVVKKHPLLSMLIVNELMNEFLFEEFNKAL